jgi:hypothetical protein
MSIELLVGAIGGGMFAALIGALPAFIMTGLFCIAGFASGGMAGLIGLAFGTFWGPHIAFSGGVAASAFAYSKGYDETKTNILQPAVQFGDASVLLVAGLFGVIGFLLEYIFSGIVGSVIPVFSASVGGWTDTVALTVFISNAIARLAFTKDGLTGKPEDPSTRGYFPTGGRLTALITLGVGIGIFMTAGGWVLLNNAPDYLGLLHVLGFGLSAFSLIFAQAGYAIETTHHVTLPTGIAVASILIIGSGFWVALIMGIITAIICALLGEFAGMTFNSHCHSHIDPPAFTIFIMTSVLYFLLPIFA